MFELVKGLAFVGGWMGIVAILLLCAGLIVGVGRIFQERERPD